MKKKENAHDIHEALVDYLEQYDVDIVSTRELAKYVECGKLTHCVPEDHSLITKISAMLKKLRERGLLREIFVRRAGGRTKRIKYKVSNELLSLIKTDKMRALKVLRGEEDYV